MLEESTNLFTFNAHALLDPNRQRKFYTCLPTSGYETVRIKKHCELLNFVKKLDSYLKNKLPS